MITRKEAKDRALEMINQIIRFEGGNSIGLTKPRKGKKSWTNNEVKQAILEDRNLYDGTIEVKGTNPVDSVFETLKFAEEHNNN